MARSRFSFDVDALLRRTAGLSKFSQKQLDQTRSRALTTLRRRLPPQAARLISDEILNLQPRTISGYLQVKQNGNAITLTGSTQRPPLSAFKPHWGGRLSPGISVTIWKDRGEEILPHTFMRPGSKEVWQRVPGSSATTKRVGLGRDSHREVVASASALVSRLPIIQRKGPQMARAVYERQHGDIYPELLEFSKTVLSDEIARLIQSLRTR